MAPATTTQLPDPETFATSMRLRAEDALAASVHHASLSQQYLALAQKFTGIAEQSAFGPGGLFEYAQRLEQEAATGIPAQPTFVDRSAAPLQPQHLTLHSPPARTSLQTLENTAHAALAAATAAGTRTTQVSPAAASPTMAGQGPDPAAPPELASTPSPTRQAPANHTSLPEQSPVSPRTDDGTNPATLPESSPTADTSSAQTPTPDLPAPEASAPAPPVTARENPGQQTAVAHSPRSTRPGRRSKISLRRLLERFRLASESTDNVRLRVRKSDTQPKLRKTSEELLQELKRSRRPATISSALTLAALVTLALGRLEISAEDPLPPLSASFSGPVDEATEDVILEQILEQAGEQQDQPTDSQEQLADPQPPPMPVEPTPEPTPQLPEPALPQPDIQLAELPLPESPVGTQPVKPPKTASTTNSSSKTPQYQHRSEAGRKALVAKYGGSAGSESAVSLALEWLAKRQRPDGSWDFTDVGPCSSPGRISNPIGGTAYALLPFLAAGQTHRQGQYRKQIQAGLQFLTTVGVATPAGYDLRGVLNQRDDDPEPNYAYYVHGAATLALCEALGMTKDRALRPACEGAVRFLINSQDPRGGGWRYNPQQPGSTSCTAIQVVALKAAERAGLPVPEQTWRGISHYLDSVSVDREGRYGYEVQKKAFDISVTSMALLSRMYAGWKRDDGDLRKGIALLDRKGPYDNLYYCYFASQVMKNWGGPEWERWNERLRDDLVSRQERDGDAAGSWAPRDRSDTSVSGGRLLTTCLATLTLEVYYRNHPLLDEPQDPTTPPADTATEATTETKPTTAAEPTTAPEPTSTPVAQTPADPADSTRRPPM